MLDKDDAENIAKKLLAQIKKKNSAHDIAFVYYNNKMIAKFGIRRGSGKSLGHDHIPSDLHFSPHKCKGLSQCSITRDEWIEHMKERRLIED